MRRFIVIVALIAATPLLAQPTNEFTVAAYNVENWNRIERQGKPLQPKPQVERDAVVAVIMAVRPDVLALTEMGLTNDLAELTSMLRAKGLDLPHQEWIQGSDPDRHVCLVSRFPITGRHSRTDYTYLLGEKTMPVQRGFVDALVKVNDHYSFRAVVAHLKSKRQSTQGDEAQMRLGEARLLRSHIGKVLKDNHDQNLIAMGDLNDTPDSDAIHAIIGEPPFQLFDLHPVDSAGKDWTHFWRARNQFSRIDYLITSPGMTNEYVAGSARIADVPGWKEASDHRMIYARFYDRDLGIVAGPAEAAAAQQKPVTSLVLIVVAILGLLVVFQLARRRPAVKAPRPS